MLLSKTDGKQKLFSKRFKKKNENCEETLHKVKTQSYMIV